MKSSILILAILFFLPFVKCTNCGPFDTLDFFDIQGINGELLTRIDFNKTETLTENMVLKSTDLNLLQIKFQVIYLSTISIQNNYGSLLACSPPEHGTSGSKSEKFNSIEIITLTDYSDQYKSGSIMNNNFRIGNNNYQTQNLDSLIPIHQNIKDEFLELQFINPPTIDGLKQFEVKILLNNGESYSWLSPKIISMN